MQLRAAASPPPVATDDELADRPEPMSAAVTSLTAQRDLLLTQRAALQAELARTVRFNRFIP